MEIAGSCLSMPRDEQSSRRAPPTASFDSVEAEIKAIEGVRVRVATPAALHRLKKGTVRAIDRQDAAALRQRFDLPDAPDE